MRAGLFGVRAGGPGSVVIFPFHVRKSRASGHVIGVHMRFDLDLPAIRWQLR